MLINLALTNADLYAGCAIEEIAVAAGTTVADTAGDAGNDGSDPNPIGRACAGSRELPGQ